MHAKAFISGTALWLVALSVALAQNSGPPPPSDDYGPNATTGHLIPQRPVISPFATNVTGVGNSSTANVPASGPRVNVVAPGMNSLLPATSGNPGGATTSGALDAPMPAPAPAASVRVNAVMPISMDLIDNVRLLKPGDQFQYQVVQDRDPGGPRILLVDEHGNVDLPVVLLTVPVANLTLRDAAFKIKGELEKEYYKPGHATVLAAPYDQARARALVYVFGQVMRPGPVQIPANEILTVFKAILAAGSFTGQADPTRVSLVRPDPNDSSKQTIFPIDVATIFKGDISKDMMVQAGDIITVPAVSDSPDFVWVTGAVGAWGPIPLPKNGTMTASEAIRLAGGFTEWADKADVTLVRHDAQGKPVKLSVNVNAVLTKGDTSKDIKLEPGDRLIVNEVIFKF